MKLLAIDGNSILNRAYYGVNGLTTKDGEFTNGICGFLNIMRKMLDETNPDAVACAFDLRAPTFRHKMYDGYKSQRKGMPDNLASQLQPLKDILSALGYCNITCEGYEGDDILGTLAASCTRDGNDCIIATGDRDSLQLIGEHVNVRLATTKLGTVLFDTAAVREKYGLDPALLIEVKALMGDSSDNIPGVAGIGEKTALSLISKYRKIDVIYENIDNIEATPSVRKKLEAGRDMAFLSRELGRINCDVPIETSIMSYIPSPPKIKTAAALFAHFEMFTIAKKWNIDLSDSTIAITQDTQKELLKPLVVVSETAELLKNTNSKIDFLAQWNNNGEAQHGIIIVDEKLVFADCEVFMTLLSHVSNLRVWGSKALYKYAFANEEGCRIVGFDGELAAYLLSPTSSNYEVMELAAQYGVSPRPIVGEIPEKFSWLAERGALISPLLDKLSEEITSNGQDKLLYEIEMPLARVLASMECLGFSLNTNALKAYGDELDLRIDELKKGIYAYSQSTFNINSSQQLGKVLFVDLGLPAKKKTKTGFSTDSDVLDSLRGKHPIVDLIMEYRQLSKLKSTYVDGLCKVVGADGRLRSTFQQTETRTGRISSTEPNLQNIPIRTKEGSRMRGFFTPCKGWKLIDADYSQIELRVLADISDDKTMINAFKNGDDIHTITAAQVFGMPENMVTPQMRSHAKAVNFGIVYGISAFSLSHDIGVSVVEADKYIKGYLETYSGVRKYMEEIIKFAHENGYVKTLFGRRRYLPELSSSKSFTRAFGERVARNTPIQGTAADIIKIAMVRVYDRLRKAGLQARLILQVHDELLVEAPEDEIELASKILREAMEGAITLKVPLVADTNVGDTWLDAK